MVGTTRTNDSDARTTTDMAFTRRRSDQGTFDRLARECVLADRLATRTHLICGSDHGPGGLTRLAHHLDWRAAGGRDAGPRALVRDPGTGADARRGPVLPGATYRVGRGRWGWLVVLRDPQYWLDTLHGIASMPVATFTWSIALIWWVGALAGLSLVLATVATQHLPTAARGQPAPRLGWPTCHARPQHRAWHLLSRHIDPGRWGVHELYTPASPDCCSATSRSVACSGASTRSPPRGLPRSRPRRTRCADSSAICTMARSSDSSASGWISLRRRTAARGRSASRAQPAGGGTDADGRGVG